MLRNRRRLGTVAIVGTGLIGTSIGLALRKSRACGRIIGWDAARANARIAKRRAAVDTVAPRLETAVRDAAVIVIAVPLGAISRILPRIVRNARAGSLILDTAPLKAEIAALAEEVLKRREDLWFVGGHPLAGSEKSGPANARAELFAGRTFFLCAPASKKIPPSIRELVRSFVRLLGAVPLEISASRHDRIIAATSALPQVVASILALSLGDKKLDRRLVGPGFLDSTRLALTSSGLWTDNLIANRTNLFRALRNFERQLLSLRERVRSRDAQRLGRFLRRAAAARQRLSRTPFGAEEAQHDR